MQLNIKDSIRFIFPGLLFYSILDMFFKSFGFSINALVLLFLLSGFSAYWITGYKYLPMVLSVLLATGSVAFLLTIGQSSIQQYFIAFASLLFIVTMVGLYRFFTPEEERPAADKVKLLSRQHQFPEKPGAGASSGLLQEPLFPILFFLAGGSYARIGLDDDLSSHQSSDLRSYCPYSILFLLEYYKKLSSQRAHAQ